MAEEESKQSSTLDTDDISSSWKDPYHVLKQEWVNSGEVLEDFTLARYKRKLREQERADFRLKVIKGETDYQAKIDALKRIDARRKMVKAVLLAPVHIPYVAAREAGKAIIEAVEPRFLKRARIRDEQLATVELHEKKALALAEGTEALRNQRKRSAIVANRVRHERGILVQHEMQTEDIRRKLELEEREKQREAQMAHLRRLRDLGNRKDDDDDERAKREEKKVREWRINHYSRVAVEAREEAKERRREVGGDFDSQEEMLRTQRGIELKKRDVRVAIDQTKGPPLKSSRDKVVLPLSKRPLGIFGATETGNDEDDNLSTPHLFVGSPDESHEASWDRLNFLESELGRANSHSRACERIASDSIAEAEAIDSENERLGVEREQLLAEHELLLRKIAGPPRREASLAEKESTHRRQNRAANISRRQSHLEHKANTARKKAETESASKALADARVAALTERCKGLRGRLEARCGGGKPPIVVGKAFQKAVEEPPDGVLNAVVAHTKLELAHGEAKNVLATRKQAREYESRVWIRDQERKNDRAHLDTMLNRLAGIANRVKESRSSEARQNLEQALQLFWARGERLRPVVERHEGTVNWWANRIESVCEGVEQWRSSDLASDDYDGSSSEAKSRSEREKLPNLQGVAHGEGVDGVIVGEMKFPKLDMYTIELVITKRNPNAENHGDRHDRCTVKLGPSLQQLTVVAAVNNVVDDFHGEVRFEIAHTVRASTLTWRIEFASSTANPATHFVVEQGAYATTEVRSLELKHGTNRVLSSYVKQIRLERAQGREQYADWLSELIRAENHRLEMEHAPSQNERQALAKHDLKTMSKNTPEQLPAPPGMWWDSKSLHGTAQRYPIDSFCKLMRGKLMQAAAKEGAASPGEFDSAQPMDTSSVTTLREENRLRRFRASASGYIARKRAFWVDKVKEAEALVGTNLEVFDEETQRWLYTRIQDVEVKWRDNGTRAAALHKAVPIDEMERAMGSPRWIDVAETRCHESTRVKPNPDTKKYCDADEAAEAANRAQALLARLEAESRKRIREAKIIATKLRFEKVRAEAVGRKRQDARIEAESMLESSTVSAAVRRIATQVVEEYRAGIVTPAEIGMVVKKKGSKPQSGLNRIDQENSDVVATTTLKVDNGRNAMDGFFRRMLTFATFDQFHDSKRLYSILCAAPDFVAGQRARRKLTRAAIVEARRRWCSNYVLAVTEMEERQWNVVAKQREAEVEAAARIERAEQEKSRKQEETREVERELERVKQRKRRSEDVRRMIGVIPNFALAVAKSTNCEHTRSKAWGHAYGKGIRCLDCGKELTQSHLDEDQQMGIGSGDDRILSRRVSRHRLNRAAYRAESNDMGTEIEEIEIERLRLEKERYAVCNTETHFYDFDDVKSVYDFDRRHRRSLGVESAATPRVEDGRRRAAHRDLLLTVGRFNNFRLRLDELGRERDEIVVEQRVLDEALCNLHTEVFKSEMKQKQVADALAQTAYSLKMRRTSQRRADNADKILSQAKLDHKHAEIQLVGLVDEFREAEATSQDLGRDVRELLEQRNCLDQTFYAAKNRATECRENADRAKSQLSDAQDSLDSMQYQRRGVLVMTPYGRCTVILYRRKDRTVVVRLGFGEPRARAYIPIDSIMQSERAIAACNLVAMRAEERRGRAYYSREKAINGFERRAMLEDETRLREKLKFDASIDEEKQLIVMKVKESVENARKFVQSKKGRREIEKRTSQSLDREAKRRITAQRAWTGKGRRPQKLTRISRIFLGASEFRKQRKEYVLERARIAAAEARAVMKRRKEERIAAETLDFVYQGLVRDFLEELAGEELLAGLEAKSMAEEETGVVIETPAHMQYAIYQVFSRWWLDKKKELKGRLERWGEYSAKEELIRDNERKKREALIRDIRRKEALEKEKKRRAEWMERLRDEEMRNRHFYREELKQSLAERRRMKNEEVATRHHLAQIAASEELAASKYNVGGDDEVRRGRAATKKAARRSQIKLDHIGKQQRQREMAAMAREDEISHQVRKETKRVKQVEAMRIEMDLIRQGFPSDEEISFRGSFSDDVGPLPSAATQDEIVAAEAARSAQRQIRIAETRARAAARRESAEKAAQEEYEAALMEATFIQSKVELEWMELEEDARLAEKKFRIARQNLDKATQHCQVKGEYELQARSKAAALQKTYDELTAKRDKANAWLDECQARANEMRRVNARIKDDTNFVDTRAITGVYQRFETNNLYVELHTFYFRSLVKIIANRAELIGTERRQLRLCDALQRNLNATRIREASLKKMWRKKERGDLLRLRRSELGKQIFGFSQRAILSESFRCWARYWMWHLSHRKAFELKYELLKQNVDLHRTPTHARIFHNSPEVVDNDDDSEAVDLMVDDETKRSPLKPHLEDLQHRPIQCTTCGVFYTEAHNHADACVFHPGQYRLSCPRSCPGYYDVRKRTTACMAHRAKRWSCCDQRSQGEVGRSSGCRRRFHMAPPREPRYGDIAKKLTNKYKASLVSMDASLAKIDADNAVHSASLEHRTQFDAVAKKLDGERAIINKFKMLGCDKYIPQAAFIDVVKDLHRRRQV